MEPGNGALGTDGVVQCFANESIGKLEANHLHAFGSMVILTGGSHSIIEDNEHGRFLTGLSAGDNHCRLIFRHAFVRVRLELLSLNGANPAHIGFLDYRNFEEIQTFSVVCPRGSRANNGGALRVVLEYRAGPLCELQGIVWRGGRVHIESISMFP